MDTVIVSLDDAVNAYDRYKRKWKNQILSIVYSIDKKQFVIAKESAEQNINCVPFVDCHQACLSIIDAYLDQPEIIEYKEACRDEMSKAKDPVVAFLWFFDHLDGAYDFERFEYDAILRILKKWCKKNQLAYSAPTEEQAFIATWLTERRNK